MLSAPSPGPCLRDHRGMQPIAPAGVPFRAMAGDGRSVTGYSGEASGFPWI
jgi:hypothetical protein